MNIELNDFLALFNVWMNNQNLSPRGTPTAIVCGLSACISSFLIRTLDVWTGMSGGSHGYALTCGNSCLQMAEVDRYRLVLGPIIFWETVDNYSNQKEPVHCSAGGK